MSTSATAAARPSRFAQRIWPLWRGGERMGWLDGDNLYLEPNIAYAVVQRIAGADSLGISMQALGKNGVLVLASVTGGNKMIEIPADRINLEFVLGNKVMVGTVNANREYFEMGVSDMAQAEAEYPGWLSKLLTDPVKGLDNYRELFNKLTSPNGAIKVFCEVA